MPIEIQVHITDIQLLVPNIKAFRVARSDGGRLPGFDAGAHIGVRIPQSGDRPVLWRSYSLIDLDPETGTSVPQPDYLFAVRRESEGGGGSLWLHDEARIGDNLTLREPVNDFPLAPDDDNVLLFAGGIGVTPIASMASSLVRRGRDFDLHYCSRSVGQMAFSDELAALAADRLHRHFDDDPQTALDIPALLDATTPGWPIYVCGPRGMIDAILAEARALGWPESRLHTELFTEAAPQAGDRPFEVTLAKSGRTFIVRADQSLLDALIEAGADPLYDCRSGYCGLCTLPVLSGDIDHRDTYLSEGDRRAGKLMQACVSRVRSGALVLDL